MFTRRNAVATLSAATRTSFIVQRRCIILLLLIYYDRANDGPDRGVRSRKRREVSDTRRPCENEIQLIIVLVIQPNTIRIVRVLLCTVYTGSLVRPFVAAHVSRGMLILPCGESNLEYIIFEKMK